MALSDEQRSAHAEYLRTDAYRRLKEEALKACRVDINSDDRLAPELSLAFAEAEGFRRAFRVFEDLGTKPIATTPVRARQISKTTTKTT